MPGLRSEAGGFARCCYGRGCGATFTLNSDKKRPKRTRRGLRRPGCLHKHLAGIAIALLGDAPMTRRLIPGLAHLGGESEVAAQLVRRREARHIADRRQHRGCDDRAYPGNGHQTPGSWIVEGLLRQHFVELRHLGGDTLKLNDQTSEHRTFLVGQRQAVEPLAACLAEEVPTVFWDQVRVQDRLNASSRTSCSRTPIRSAIWRRRFRVSSSATHTSGRKPAACSRARTAASILSVLTRA